MTQKQYAVLLIILLFQGISKADTLNITSFGRLPVSNFSPQQYQADNQCWDICMGENGLIYIANGPLLEGGSDFWRKHYLPDGNYIRSLHSLEDNKILVGANQELGIFERTGIPGETSYVSLMDRLDEQYHAFGSIWQIMDHEGAHYLRAGKGLFKYESDTIIALLFGDIIDYFQFLNEKLFVLVAGQGLGTFDAQEFNLLPYGDYFSDKRIVAITAYDQSKDFLIFTDDHGIFKANLDTFSLLSAFNLDEIIESQITDARLLNNQYFAIGTVKAGLYILDRSGHTIQHLNKKNGLQNNTIIRIFPDSSNNLWLGLDYGLSYVYLNNGLSIIDSELDIGTGYVSKYYNNKLYLGTNQGLFYLDWNNLNQMNPGDMEIHTVQNISGQVWDLYVSDGILFCGHHKGLFRIENDDAILISSIEGSWQLDSLVSLPGYYLQSTYRGYYLYKFNENKELELIDKMDMNETTRSFAQDQMGYIWNTSSNNKLFRYRIDNQKHNIAERIEYSGKDGFIFDRIRITGNKKQVFFDTENGLYTYNHDSQTFESKKYFNDFLDLNDLLIEFFEDEYNRIWYVTPSEMGYFSLHFGQMEKVIWPFNIVKNSYNHFFGKINVIDRKNILFGVDKGFYHFNGITSNIPPKSYKSYIIDMNTYSPPEGYSKMRSGQSHPIYLHKKNSFEFAFTSNIIESQEKIHYKYRLEGYDENWSEWTDRTTKDYNNLHEGSYTFHVKAMDDSGIESSESTFTFQVKPPIYRSALAYLIYIILFIVILLILRHYRIRKIEKERKKISTRKQQELEERRKKYEEEQLKANQKITKLENDKLHQDLRHKSRELSNSVINILHKNEILLNLKKEMQDLYLEKNLGKRDFKIKRLIQVIENEISTKKDLEVFDSNFNAVHEEFIKNLKEKYPQLNQNDHRLCTFIKMNKSTKEIATFLNMSIRGVETSRYRLRKKMNLSSDGNLYDIISDI
jgi:DNA-binding CsgD family transcriptional regulator/cell division protein FtsL